MIECTTSAELGKKKTEWFNPASEDGSERETAKVLVPVQVPTNRQTKTYKHAHLKDEREAKEAKLLSSKREAQLVHGEPHSGSRAAVIPQGHGLSLSAFELPRETPSLHPPVTSMLLIVSACALQMPRGLRDRGLLKRRNKRSAARSVEWQGTLREISTSSKQRLVSTLDTRSKSTTISIRSVSRKLSTYALDMMHTEMSLTSAFSSTFRGKTSPSCRFVEVGVQSGVDQRLRQHATAPRGKLRGGLGKK